MAKDLALPLSMKLKVACPHKRGFSIKAASFLLANLKLHLGLTICH